jgi:UDP:flavonoid glycosyltransferase YjiC (YdhE family)
MPTAFDQPDNAARLRALGVGAALPPKGFGGPAVARELRALLESREVADNCEEVARRVRDGDPVAETCRLIEALADSGTGRPTGASATGDGAG